MDLLALLRAALSCSDLVLVTITLFPFGDTGNSNTSAFALLTVFSRLFGFAVSLVSCVAGPTSFFSLSTGEEDIGESLSMVAGVLAWADSGRL